MEDRVAGTKDHGLAGRGTELLAYQALPALRPGDASVAVDVGPADDSDSLPLQGQLLDGLGRADLAALVAVPVTVSVAVVQLGREEPLHACPEYRRLDHVGRTDLHALAAARAGGKEVLLVAPSRRPDEQGVSLDAPQSGKQEEASDEGQARGAVPIGFEQGE